MSAHVAHRQSFIAVISRRPARSYSSYLLLNDDLSLITRVHGKPQEKLEVSRQVDDFDLTKLSLEEIREMKNRILAEHPELAEFTGRARPSPLKN